MKKFLSIFCGAALLSVLVVSPALACDKSKKDFTSQEKGEEKKDDQEKKD